MPFAPNATCQMLCRLWFRGRESNNLFNHLPEVVSDVCIAFIFPRSKEEAESHIFFKCKASVEPIDSSIAPVAPHRSRYFVLQGRSLVDLVTVLLDEINPSLSDLFSILNHYRSFCAK